MSFFGYVRLFTERQPKHPYEWVIKVIDLLGCTKKTVFSVGKNEVWSEWNAFKRYRDNGDEFDAMSKCASLGNFSQLDINIIRHFDYKNCVLWLSPYPTELLTKISSSHMKSVPTSICGTFGIGDIEINFGMHDIYSSMEMQDGEDGIFFGRAFFSFCLCGKGYPALADEYRKTVLQVPEIVELKRNLEVFTGPLKMCAYWD